MQRNLTIRLDSELIREAKVLAAMRGTSISALVASQLGDLVRSEKTFEAAKKRALSVLEQGFDLGWEPAADRQELHERSGVQCG